MSSDADMYCNFLFSQLYETISHLQDFAEINRTGFRKIIKKYDKNMGQELLPKIMHEIDTKLHFGTV